MIIRFAKTAGTRYDVQIEFRTPSSKKTSDCIEAPLGEICIREHKAKVPAPRLSAIVSLGAEADITLDKIRRAAGCAAQWLNSRQFARAAVNLDGLRSLDIDHAAQAVCEGLALGAFRFRRRKSGKAKGNEPTVDLLLSRISAAQKRSLQSALDVCDAVNLARDWGHEPPNIINPVTLAKRITALARSAKLKCRVYNEKQLAAMKAGALLNVGVASKTPARLIVLEYPGTSRAKNARPVILVGKAITFDTGGYSLKDKDSIVGMKYDKCGGMAVVGALQAAATLKLKTPVVGIIAAAENMISGDAYRPNDIITTMSGKTVEIISTDAEGRLVLADALTYAQKKYRPKAVIDLATLTGGVVVALGAVRAGIFSNNDDLADALIESGDNVHERLWRLPLDEDYFELIKGDDSDIKNSGGREAHPVIGGIFLKQFVDPKVPWAHLDIAGTATCDKDLPYCPKGATGFGVRLLVDYLKRM